MAEAKQIIPVAQYSHREFMKYCADRQDGLAVEDGNILMGYAEDVTRAVETIRLINQRLDFIKISPEDDPTNKTRVGAIVEQLQERQSLLARSLVTVHDALLQQGGHLWTIDGFGTPQINTSLETRNGIQLVRIEARGEGEKRTSCLVPLASITHNQHPDAAVKIKEALAKNAYTGIRPPEFLEAKDNSRIYPPAPSRPAARPRQAVEPMRVIEEEPESKRLVREITELQHEITMMRRTGGVDQSIAFTMNQKLLVLLRSLLATGIRREDIDWPHDGYTPLGVQIPEPITIKTKFGTVRVDLWDVCAGEGQYKKYAHESGSIRDQLSNRISSLTRDASGASGRRAGDFRDRW